MQPKHGVSLKSMSGEWKALQKPGGVTALSLAHSCIAVSCIFHVSNITISNTTISPSFQNKRLMKSNSAPRAPHQTPIGPDGVLGEAGPYDLLSYSRCRTDGFLQQHCIWSG